MSVQLTGGLEAQARWQDLAASVSSRMRDAGYKRWRVLWRSLETADGSNHARPPQRDVSDLGLWIWVDVADMAIEVAFPPGTLPADDAGLARLLIQMIDEAEDETDDDYGPPEDDSTQ
jgi:hypothetical protein